jgi:hypothetical protein
MLKILDAFSVALILTAAVFPACAQEAQGQAEGPTPEHHPGLSMYWTASGPVYFDQQLDAQSRLIFPYSDEQRFQWLTDRMSEHLDRLGDRSYSVRVK